MKDQVYYQELTQKAIQQIPLSTAELLSVLDPAQTDFLSIIHSAFAVRKHFCGTSVKIHILNNVKNGSCPEDCNYCAQGTSSSAPIVEYPEKSDDEILEEAARAYENGAYRYCMVYAGRGTGETRAKRIAQIIRKIKTAFPLQVCVSAGLVDAKAAEILKEAGLDRLNHNLNTTQERYEQITTTHTYQDRLNTLHNARTAGLQVCSGIIAGMGESDAERVELAMQLRQVQSRSIPVNFLIPIAGNALTQATNLDPQKALRILCMFRFSNPDAEIRAAAGREYHLRSLENLSLYPANSLFLEGYLNTRGSEARRTLQMIHDAGFTIESNKELDSLLQIPEPIEQVTLKNTQDLHPAIASHAQPHA
jgi:biotin synthase